MKKLNIIDMFCGGGGESTGLIEAAHECGFPFCHAGCDSRILHHQMA